MVLEVTLNSAVSGPSQSANAGRVQQVDSQQSVSSSTAITPPPTESSSEVNYFSPTVKIDKESQTAIFIFRDQETGEVIQEFPAEEASRVYEEASSSQPRGKTVDISDNAVKASENSDATVETDFGSPSLDVDINQTVPEGAA